MQSGNSLGVILHWSSCPALAKPIYVQDHMGRVQLQLVNGFKLPAFVQSVPRFLTCALEVHKLSCSICNGDSDSDSDLMV